MKDRIELDNRKFIMSKGDELGGQFTLSEEGASVEHSISFGTLVVDFDKEDRIVGLEIYEDADYVLRKRRVTEEEKVELRNIANFVEDGAYDIALMKALRIT